MREGEGEFAAGRAYYAMLYAAEALLNEEGVRYRKHTGVRGAFGERFAKTARLDPKFHRQMLDAFDKRLLTDYGVDARISPEEVLLMIQQAQEFLAEAKRFLEDGK